MSILKYKYKAHRLVNTLFYVIVFVIGFVLGFGAKEINFSNLISNVLMIDSVSAYTIHEDEDKKINEEFIYDLFSENYENFNLENFPYIHCEEHDYYTGFHTLQCHALNEKAFDQFSYYDTRSNYYLFEFHHTNVEHNIDYLRLTYDVSDDIVHKVDYGSSWIYYYFNDKDDTTYTNYDIEIDGEIRSDWNLLDFNGADSEFNPNLFKDNPDFKEVCVPNNKNFAISTNNFELLNDENSQYNGTKSYSSYEFLWFPYKIEGLSTYLYDNSKDDNVWVLDEDETYFEMNPGYWYWLNSKDEIDLYFSKEDPGNYLNSLGYIDKYSYYGWYFHPFIVRYANSGLRQFSVFYFKNDTTITKLDGTKLEDNEQYCFYIRNDFDVNLLNTDEFGDKYGDIIIMGDENLEISTSVNVSKLDSKGLFEKIKIFLNKMTRPLDFVKDYIFEFYESMPYLLKLFIISVFGLIVIKILIGMVVR